MSSGLAPSVLELDRGSGSNFRLDCLLDGLEGSNERGVASSSDDKITMSDMLWVIRSMLCSGLVNDNRSKIFPGLDAVMLAGELS